jgi:hypothetical protein
MGGEAGGTDPLLKELTHLTLFMAAMLAKQFRHVFIALQHG